MRPDVADRLLAHNREFYSSAWRSFAETRTRLQPGVARVLGGVGPDDAIVDIGCGNALVGAELARRGHRGRYVGVDQEPHLLTLARQGAASTAEFVCSDVSQPGWTSDISGRFDWVLVFAVLQHIPTFEHRAALLVATARLLARGGRLAFSAWNLSTSERMRDRIAPWHSIGLDDLDVDEGDHLVEWRRGVSGTRYVHEFSEPETERLRLGAGFDRVESFDSDGEGGGLGHYEIWMPAYDSL